MRSEQKLRRTADFGRVIECGRSVVSPLAVLYVLPRAGSAGRLGIAAGRRLGKAVVRNRLRRRWREAVRRAPVHLPPDWDAVLVARSRARFARFPELQHAWEALLKRAGVL